MQQWPPAPARARAGPAGSSAQRLARQRKRLSREELTPLAREALFRAAAKVVGQVGYAEASVARITAAAGVAQGTFYLYFAARQSLFEELLPHARREMLAKVRERVAGAGDFFEVEARGVRAFLDYLRQEPGFIRILNEAEAVAPQAYRNHYEDIAERHRRQLQQASAAGEVRMLDAEEIDTVVYLMMGARVSLYQRCQGPAARKVEAAVDHYIAMVRAWLQPRTREVPGRVRQRGSGAA